MVLYGKVDWIVTDCPVLMNTYYASRYCPSVLAAGIRSATLAFYNQAKEDGHEHFHIFLKRTKPYLGEGRYQTEAEAKEIDIGIKNLLVGLKFTIIESEPDESVLLKLFEEIKRSNKL